MKRLHVHVSVADLPESIRFYSALFAAEPTVTKTDYAKWMLDDPRVNFAISRRAARIGLDHLGIQTESDRELEELHQRLAEAASPVRTQKAAFCCYAKSDKSWAVDPQGVAWEAFNTLSTIPVSGKDSAVPVKTEPACCTPGRECR